MSRAVVDRFTSHMAAELDEQIQPAVIWACPFLYCDCTPPHTRECTELCLSVKGIACVDVLLTCRPGCFDTLIPYSRSTTIGEVVVGFDHDRSRSKQVSLSCWVLMVCYFQSRSKQVSLSCWVLMVLFPVKI